MDAWTRKRPNCTPNLKRLLFGCVTSIISLWLLMELFWLFRTYGLKKESSLSTSTDGPSESPLVSNNDLPTTDEEIPPWNHTTSFVSPTYYMTAYLVTARGGTPNIRLPSVRNCNNEVKTRLQIGNIEKILSEGNRHSQCPVNNFPQMCQVKSALEWAAVLEEDLPQPLPGHVTLIGADGIAKRVPLVDSREGGPEKRIHTLGACLKPMFAFIDWRRLIVYLEFWISQGTTIFLFYIHSLSKEVDEIFRIYEQDRNIEIVRIGWGDFPSELPEGHPDNPNNNVWMVGQEAQRNDCILRFRSRVKYAVTLDTDEIIGLGYQTTLIQLLDRYFEHGQLPIANSAPGALIFLHTLAKAAQSQAHHPSEVTFREYHRVFLEDLIKAPSDRSKPIYKPDNVYDAGVHLSLGFEVSTSANAVVPPDDGRLIHLRAMRPYWFIKGEFEAEASGAMSSFLAKDAEKWLQSWKRRTDGVWHEGEFRWNLNELDMLNTTVRCQREGFVGNYCPSVSRCIKRLDKFYSSWIRLQGAWIEIPN